MALFVLVLVGMMGTALLFLTQTEVRMGKAGLGDKRAFYLAEAAQEDGRMTLFAINGSNPFTDDLVAFAGANGQFDLDPASLFPIYDGAGALIGVSGYGDDVPLRAVTGFGDHFYMAFVTNDPAEGVTTTMDANDLVMVTGVGAGRGREFEIVQAIVERWDLLPHLPPATITMLGPTPSFLGGDSNVHTFTGDDCDGRTTGPGRNGKNQGSPSGPGQDGLNVPVVATIGPDAETSAELGMTWDPKTGAGPEFVSGDWTGSQTFADLTDPSEPTLQDSGFTGLDPMWTDCALMHEWVETMRGLATVICTSSDCALPPRDITNIIFADGDFTVGPDGGAGVLVVTGTLLYDGRASWNGMIFVFGEGRLVQKGAGNGYLSGAIMVADIAGPDDAYGTADDCTGGENGFDSALYDQSGGGNAETVYCSADILAAKPNPPYRIVGFRQL